MIDKLKNNLPLILAIYVAFIFLQSLFFKFQELLGSPADVTVYIFRTIGGWIRDSLGLEMLGTLFTQKGGLVIGLAELVASILILRSSTREYGALLGLAVISGAIFFHLFTPLGLFPYNDLSCLTPGCPREYFLFFMAVGVWLSCAWICFNGCDKLLGLIGKSRAN